jgi:hypothetical protein
LGHVGCGDPKEGIGPTYWRNENSCTRVTVFENKCDYDDPSLLFFVLIPLSQAHSYSGVGGGPPHTSPVVLSSNPIKVLILLVLFPCQFNVNHKDKESFE